MEQNRGFKVLFVSETACGVLDPVIRQNYERFQGTPGTQQQQVNLNVRIVLRGLRKKAIQTASTPSKKATTVVRIVVQWDRPKPKELRSTFVTMVKTADTRPGYYLASADAGLTSFRSLLLETTVGAVLMVQVDNLIPIVLNCEKSVIRGIRGMGVLSGFMER